MVSDSRYEIALYHLSEFVAKRVSSLIKLYSLVNFFTCCVFCRIDIDKSVVFLENECYKKYGKSGKSFYLSQMVSTTRWLSTADPIELMNKLSSSNPALPSENVASIVNCTPTSSNLLVPMSASVNDEEVRDNAGSQDPIRSPASPLHGSPSAKLPPILSFSQFINSRKVKNHASASNRESPDRGKRKLEKRMRFQ